MHETWQKLIPVATGFFGAAAMMTFLGQMPPRKWVVALSSGPLLAYLATDGVVSYLVSVFAWLPTGEEATLKLSGLVGALIGLMALFLIGAAATLGKRVADNPTDLWSSK